MLVDKLQHLVADEWIVSNMFVNAFSVAAKLAARQAHLIALQGLSLCTRASASTPSQNPIPSLSRLTRLPSLRCLNYPNSKARA